MQDTLKEMGINDPFKRNKVYLAVERVWSRLRAVKDAGGNAWADVHISEIERELAAELGGMQNLKRFDKASTREFLRLRKLSKKHSKKIATGKKSVE